MKKNIYLILIPILFLTIKSYWYNSYNECSSSNKSCKPWYYCDTYNNKCKPDDSYCKKNYWTMAKMNTNWVCWCWSWWSLVNWKCENTNNICKTRFWENSKSYIWVGNKIQCKCDEWYIFKGFDILLLDPLKNYSTCVLSWNKKSNTENINKNNTENITQNKKEITIKIIQKPKKYITPTIDENTLSLYKNSADKLWTAWIINYQSNKNDYKVANNISRREILKIILKFSWKNLWTNCELKFKDVQKNDWWCNYIETALDFWLINLNTNFRPNDKVSKIEALKMIFKSKNISVEKTLNWSEWYINKWIELWLFDSLKNENDFATRWFIFEIIWKLLDLNISNNAIDDNNSSWWEEVDLDLSDLFWKDSLFWEILKEDKNINFYDFVIWSANRLSQSWIIADYSTDTDKYDINDYIIKWYLIKIAINTSNIEFTDNCEWLFQDLKNNNWECKYAEAALKSWFISKTNLFEPNKFATYDEALLLIWKAKWFKNKKDITDYFDTFIDNFSELFEKYASNNITKWDLYALTDLMIYERESLDQEEDLDLSDLFKDIIKE